MTNVKPATDEEIATIRDYEVYHGDTQALIGRLVARHYADREEIAASWAAIAALKAQKLLESQIVGREIAALKAEVERFSHPCHLCFGDGSLYGGRTVSKTECPACHGTGRAR